MTSWIILRTAGHTTLRLAASLAEAGFETWTPVEKLKRLRGGKVEEVETPLISQLVFSHADRMQELIELSHNPARLYQVWDSEKRKMVTRGHPYFTPFKSAGEIRPVPDAQLAALRAIERRRKPRGTIEPIAVGTAVSLTQGGFAGLSGVVAEVRGKFATVVIPGFPAGLQIACWLLREELDSAQAININRGSSEQAPSAKAA